MPTNFKRQYYEQENEAHRRETSIDYEYCENGKFRLESVPTEKNIPDIIINAHGKQCS